MLNLYSRTRPQAVELLLLTAQRLIPTPSLDEADFQGQAHLGHPLKSAIPVQAGAQAGKLLEHATSRVVIFQGLEIMRAPADTRALIDEDAIGRGDDQLLAGVALLLAGVVALALLLVFRLALGLFNAINDEGQFGVSFTEFFNRADALLAAFVFGLGQ